MRAYLIVLALFAARPAAAVEPLDAAQRRCFCVKFSAPGVMPPYFLAKMDWEECKGRKPDFMAGRTIYDTGLLNCDDLLACLNSSPKEKKAREAAMKKVADITNTLMGCCPKDKGDCDKTCVAALEPLLNKAKAESARLEQMALRRQDACIAKARQLKPPADDADAAGDTPGGPMGASN